MIESAFERSAAITPPHGLVFAMLGSIKLLISRGPMCRQPPLRSRAVLAVS